MFAIGGGSERRLRSWISGLLITGLGAWIFIPDGQFALATATTLAAAALIVVLVRDRPASPSAISPSTVSDYMAVLAHELSGPIVSVGAAAQVLAKELHGRAAERTALGIAEESRQIYALLESLSDLSALESGRLSLSVRALDLGELVQGGVALVPPAERTLVVDVPHERIVVSADERRIRQVMRNLVDNAAKYSGVGTQIEMRVGTTPDHRSAIVQVRDHGPGVPPAERSRLFEKFTRLSTAGGTRGSGLGLFLCRAIVRAHGGEIWGEWPAGGGTTLSFTLPLVPAGVTRKQDREVFTG